MDYVYYAIDYSNSLSHHGIKGQKWGLRRFQNPDGSYTNAGKARRSKGIGQRIREHNLKTTKRAYDASNIHQLNYKQLAENHPDKAKKYESLRDRYIDGDGSFMNNTYGANYWHNSFQKQAQSYIKKYGQKAFDDLKMNTTEIDRGKNLTEQAVDDMVEVLNGNMSPKYFNKVYSGTGYKVR